MIDSITFLILKFYFTIRNLVFERENGILMGIDPALSWDNIFPYFFEFKFVQQLISKRSPGAYMFHDASMFVDYLRKINDDGEFCPSYKYIYHKQLELKLEHQVEHRTFLDLND